MSFRQTKLRALDYIRSHTLAKGEAPSIREIAHGIGQASPGSVHRIVDILEEEGKIRRTKGVWRSIEVVPVTAVISVELPPELYVQVQAVARKANVSLAAVVIEAVRDGFKHLRSRRVPKSAECETSSGGTNGRAEPGAHPQHGNRA